MFFLVLFYIRILNNINKILVIIQRSNGDVFFSQTLIAYLYKHFNHPKIDLLVNDDTVGIANLTSNINSVYTFSYEKKKKHRWKQEKNLIRSIFMNYDLSISLTASDRSVFYALFASKNSISAVDKNIKKSWWKKILLSYFYYFDNNKHIHLNNLQPLDLLKIKYKNAQVFSEASKESITNVKKRLKLEGINNFIIFHPSAQYEYKIYPTHLRIELLTKLNSLNVPVIVTGGSSLIDMNIKKSLPLLNNVHDFIGETSLEEYLALSQLSSAYIGMDTLNMHIAASQNKRIFAIFGPTNLSMWAPWSNNHKTNITTNSPIQTYHNVTIFQAEMSCVACGKAGCDDSHGKSECLYRIEPSSIFSKIKIWHNGLEIEESS